MFTADRYGISWYLGGGKLPTVELIPKAHTTFSIQGRTGVVVVKTKQSILVGFYAEGGVAGNAAQTVESLADYMIGLGY